MKDYGPALLVQADSAMRLISKETLDFPYEWTGELLDDHGAALLIRVGDKQYRVSKENPREVEEVSP